MATKTGDSVVSWLQVALGSVTNVDEAVKWLSYTYLYVRMRANPLAYGINHKVYQVGGWRMFPAPSAHVTKQFYLS